MKSEIRIYAFLAILVVGTSWLERTANAQYEGNLWGLCDQFQSDGNIQGWCYGYDESWGCYHYDYDSIGSLGSPTRSAGFGGYGMWGGEAALPWAGETGYWETAATMVLSCSCIYGQPVGINVSHGETISPSVSLSPSGTHQVDQYSDDVTVTATVSNPEFASLVAWSGDGIDVGDPMSRIVHTETVDDFLVTASLGQQSVTTTVRVNAACPSIPNETFSGASSGMYPYSVNTALMANDEVDGVRDGFLNWTTKNAQSGLNASYCEVGTGGCGASASITVAEGDAGSSGGLPNYAKTEITVSGGRAVSGEMTISSISSNVLGRTPYKKVVQHELGHFHGMAHATSAPVRSTVMRYPLGVNGTYLPDAPTQCDADKALERGL